MDFSDPIPASFPVTGETRTSGARKGSDSAAFVAAMPTVARELLGEPNKALSSKNELRFGSQGSLSVDLRKGRWYDHEAGKGGGVLALVMREQRCEKLQAVEWLCERGHIEAKPTGSRARGPVVATYDYRDENGALLFQVQRLQPPGAKKTFKQRRPDGNGGWIPEKAKRSVLYRLPEVISAVAAGRTIYIAEGEKGAEAIAKLGLTATCSPEGAGKWKRPEHSPPLAGADVVILPDNDATGRKHRDMVASALAGIAARVRALELPGLGEKEDVFDWVARGGTATELERLAKSARNAEPGPDWLDACQVDAQGERRGNLANALLALRSHHELSELLAYDEMLKAEMLMKPIPKGRQKLNHARPLQDTDVTAIQEYLQTNGLEKVGPETTHQAVALRAREHSFHPVREYLNELQWDGKSRLSTWLTTYLGVKDTLYAQQIGRMFIIAMVARVLRPGCKCDYMLIMEGLQGFQKSTVCRTLAGQWFSDSLPNLQRDEVRVSQHIRGKWLIEIGEMSAMGKAANEDLKAFITRNEECFTPKYGRKEVREPRQCVFIGTTNKATYLRDETGGRRFWPIVVTSIDLEALTRDRDQLFAEAVQAFKQGENWWPSPEFEMQHIKPEQDARFESDLWEQPIASWVNGKSKVLVLEIARGALFIQTDRLGTADQRRITAVLTYLGWSNGKRGPNGERYWYPAEGDGGV